MSKKKANPSELRTLSVKDRFSKVSVEHFASPLAPGMQVRDFLDALPGLLAGRALREVAERIAKAAKEQKPILLGMGAHVIKVGLAPVLISWMERGIITGLLMNGAGVIHDTEIALWGKTSEDVGPALDEGMFGVAEETAGLINLALSEGNKERKGFGEAVARRLAESNPPYADLSLLCEAHRRGLPVTVHVAIGTDIVHMHPAADGAAIGETSLRDFHRLTSQIARLEGGAYLNVGSAVVLPEVFMKALNLARNQGNRVEEFTTVDMDFIKHYRPSVNVVDRPVRMGGRGYQLIGHHELNLPLLAVAVLERLGAYPDETEQA
jgi:deoxyhypusine synthase